MSTALPRARADHRVVRRRDRVMRVAHDLASGSECLHPRSSRHRSKTMRTTSPKRMFRLKDPRSAGSAASQGKGVSGGPARPTGFEQAENECAAPLLPSTSSRCFAGAGAGEACGVGAGWQDIPAVRCGLGWVTAAALDPPRTRCVIQVQLWARTPLRVYPI